MTLLNCDTQLYSKKLATRKGIAIAVAVITVILNVLLSVFRTDNTHTAFLVINILADIACGWFEIAWYLFAISMQNKILKLATANAKLTQSVSGTVTDVSEDTQVVSKLQCRRVTVEGDETRIVFVVDGSGIALECGAKYSVTTVDNIAICAEVTE